MKCPFHLLVAALFLPPHLAIANDSSAVLGAGGLELTKSADIRMAREDLSISPTAIKIRYEFVNDGPADIETIVAFPLPDIDTHQFFESDLGSVTDDPVNFVGFQITVEGRSVPVQSEQRAFLGDKDVSESLRSMGVALNTAISGTSSLEKLTPERKRQLEQAGLIDDGAPKWKVSTKYFWSQKFPAGRPLVVEHSYKPVTGSSFLISDDLSPSSERRRDYCIDNATAAGLRRRMTANQDTLRVMSTEYILKTANNWKGGIGKFQLTIDKLKPDNVLSLCWDGNLKKVGPTRFESRIDNFRPAQDIKFIVIEAAQ